MDEKEPLKVLNIRKLTYITVDPFNDGRLNNPTGRSDIVRNRMVFFRFCTPDVYLWFAWVTDLASGRVELRNSLRPYYDLLKRNAINRFLKIRQSLPSDLVRKSAVRIILSRHQASR